MVQLHNFRHEFDVNIIWNFFATSHGKGAVYCIGGTIKHTVWSCVKAGSAEDIQVKANQIVMWDCVLPVLNTLKLQYSTALKPKAKINKKLPLFLMESHSQSFRFWKMTMKVIG